MSGYVSILESECLNRQVHLMDLVDDIAQYKWEVATGYHSIMFNMLEQGHIKWDDEGTKQDLRRNYIWGKPNALLPVNSSHKQSTHKSIQGNACPDFQSNSFDHTVSRSQHICAYCLRVAMHKYTDSEANCRRKKYYGEKKTYVVRRCKKCLHHITPVSTLP